MWVGVAYSVSSCVVYVTQLLVWGFCPLSRMILAIHGLYYCHINIKYFKTTFNKQYLKANLPKGYIFGIMKKITRIIFLCFATGIFFFQMYNSIQKYVSFPIITANSLVSVNDIDLPITYICQVLFYSMCFFHRKKVLLF